MTMPVSPLTSPLLRLFKEREPRDLYLASKADLESGMTVCRHGRVVEDA